jgi:ABC-type oligopeptide transport system substrate-binding subunit
MQIIKEPISLNILWENRKTDFTEMMKIVVDIDKEILAIDAEMHADLENLLLMNNAEQKHLWGANIYPFQSGDNYLEYTSFINIRPSQNNRSMEVIDLEIRKKIIQIVNKLIVR